VLAGAPEAGAEGVELVHEVVLEPTRAKRDPGWISPPDRYSPINESAEMEVQPHTDLLFSVPLNHVGPSWHMRITLIPSGPRLQDTLDFAWANIPPKERSAWKK